MGEVEQCMIYMDDKLYKAAQIQGATIPTHIDSNELAWQVTHADKSNVLHVAARCGNALFISLVLKQLNPAFHFKLLCMSNSKGETPMHMGAQSGHLDTIRTLLKAHDEVDEIPYPDNNKKHCWMERDEKGDTPMHKALRCGHQDVALELLKRDVRLLSVDNNARESPAYLAAHNYCIEFFSRILDADSDGHCYASFSGPRGQTAFHAAAKLPGDIMSLLIQIRNELLKVQDDKGKTVLHYVVEGGKRSRECMAEILLQNDNSLAYIHDNDGFTPLHKASSLGSLVMVETILDLSPQSIDIRKQSDGKTALHVAKMEACFLGQCLKTKMKMLINEVDNDGNTPLHLALMSDDVGSANALLQVSGINWRLPNNQGHTPMDLCKSEDQIPIRLKCLASAWRVEEVMVNAEIMSHENVIYVDDVLKYFDWDDDCLTYRSQNGDSILHLAARDGRMEIITKAQQSDSSHLLLLMGENTKGETPLHLAAEYGYLKVVNVITSLSTSMNRSPERTSGDNFEEVEANVQAGFTPWMLKARDGDTPAHRAVRNGHQKIALLLMRLGQELVSSVNKDDESLLYLAAEHNCQEVLTEILCDSTGIFFSISGPNGQNPLHAAARNAGEKIVNELSERRPDLLSMVDHSGKTPLHEAVENGRRNVLVILLNQNKAAAFVYDNEGFTPLLRAVALGFEYCAARILNQCPQSAEFRDLGNNRNVLHLAKLPFDNLKFIMSRRANGASWMNETDGDGNTPLQSAIIHAQTSKAVAFIRMRGVNIRIRNMDQQMPSDLCTNNQGEIYRSMQRRIMWHPRSCLEKYFAWTRGFRYLLQHQMEMKTDKEVEQMYSSIVVVAALLVTITFAALFTIPGGYKDGGEATQMKKVSIQVFLASDVFALFTGVGLLLRSGYDIILAPSRLEWPRRRLVGFSFMALQFSLMATIVAFISALYVVVSHAAIWVFIFAIVAAALYVVVFP